MQDWTDLDAALELLRDGRYGRTREHLANVLGAGEAHHRDDAELVRRAASLAIHLHHDQEDRPDGSPYLEHVAGVARSVADWSGSSGADVIAGALLHDALEDQQERLAAQAAGEGEAAARAALEEAFGPDVSGVVVAVTNPHFDRIIGERFGACRGRASRDAIRLTLYAQHFVEVFAHPRAALVKLADFRDNALRIGDVRNRPRLYAWFVRKYGPCVAFLIDHLEGEPEFPHREARLAELRAAWKHHYGPRGLRQ